MKIFICIISVLLFLILIPASFAAFEDKVSLKINIIEQIRNPDLIPYPGYIEITFLGDSNETLFLKEMVVDWGNNNTSTIVLNETLTGIGRDIQIINNIRTGRNGYNLNDLNISELRINISKGIHRERIIVDPAKIFNDGFIPGKEKTIHFELIYIYNNESKILRQDFTMKVVPPFIRRPANAESVGTNLSNNTMNLSNNIIPPEEKPSDNQTEIIGSNDVNNSGVGKTQQPESREVVIVYFKEMPVSLEEFASKHNGKLVFARQEIKMAAFETKQEKRPGITSQQTQDFIDRVSKDPLVEQSFEDGFMFLNANINFKTKPIIHGPEYYNKLGIEYVPNRVRVGFWRFPPSLEEFAYKYDGKLMNLSDSGRVLKHASFETDNISEFINRISSDPYIRSIELWDLGKPSDIGGIGVPTILANNTSETTYPPKSPGLESVLSIGIMVSIVCIMRRRKNK